MLDSDLEFLRLHHADQIGHSGGSLLEHLRGTAELLAGWGLPAHVVRAGLFHSIYGTGAYDETTVSPARRAAISDRIGPDAEAIVYLFCELDRDSIAENATRTGGHAGRSRHTGDVIALEPRVVRELFHVASANWVEQRDRLDPALCRARCGEYRAMLPFLEPAARATVAAVIDTTLAAPARPTLVDLFAFRDASAVDTLCAELDIRYLGAISHQLAKRVDGRTLARLGALPDDGYLALLRGSETCFHVTAGGEVAAYVEGALQVEEVRAGLRAATDRPAWSATGDAYYPAGTVERSAVYDPERAYTAPIVGGWIAADFHGPAVRRRLDQIVYKSVPFGPAEDHTDEERTLVLDRIRGALEGIDRTNPVVTRFLRYALHTIIPRKQTNPALYPSSFKGSSTAATIHRANIYNIQQSNVDIARLAQSILHESVHNHLYKRELFEPTLVDVEAGEALRVVSPWSGNTLDLYVFVHSSTVYYALHSFFANPAAAQHLPAETVEWFRARAVNGFSSPAWAAIVREHGHLIAPDVRRDLRAMRAEVLR